MNASSSALLWMAVTVVACAGRDGPRAAPAQGGNMVASPVSPQVHDAVVRYQVADVERSVTFYTQHLGFTIEHRAGDVFASVTRGKLRLLLGGPRSSGSRP